MAFASVARFYDVFLRLATANVVRVTDAFPSGFTSTRWMVGVWLRRNMTVAPTVLVDGNPVTVNFMTISGMGVAWFVAQPTGSTVTLDVTSTNTTSEMIFTTWEVQSPDAPVIKTIALALAPNPSSVLGGANLAVGIQTSATLPSGEFTMVALESGAGWFGYAGQIYPTDGTPTQLTMVNNSGSVASIGPDVAGEGSGSGAFTWAGTADGPAGGEGDALGAFTWAGSATGKKVSGGVAAGDFQWNGREGLRAFLLAEYGFNEGAGLVVHDSSGERLDLKVDSPVAVDWRTGVALSSLSSQVTGLLTGAGSPLMEQPPPFGYSAMMWAYAGDGNTFGGTDAYIEFSQIFMESFTNSGTGLTKVFINGLDGVDVDRYTWVHLAMVVALDGTATGYVNGMPVGTDTASAAFPDNIYVSTSYDARIDDLRVFSKALTEEEVQYWMNLKIGMPYASGEGGFGWTGSATGESDHSGQATGAFMWAGAASGSSGAEGSAAGAFTWAGTAIGASDPEGSANGSFLWAGAATGNAKQSGTASGGYGFAGAASGSTPNGGTAYGEWMFTGSAASIDWPWGCWGLEPTDDSVSLVEVPGSFDLLPGIPAFGTTLMPVGPVLALLEDGCR